MSDETDLSEDPGPPSVDESKVAFVDTETFGLDPQRHPIWEVAVIVDGTEHLWHVLWPPSAVADAQPEAMELTRFSERYLSDDVLVLSPPESAAHFAELVEGRHLVGAVVSFDEERLRLQHNAHLGVPERYPWHYHLIDVEALMVGALAARGERIELPWKSHDLSTRIGVPPIAPEVHHTALGDARWAREVYLKVLGDPDYVVERNFGGAPAVAL